MEEKRIGLGPIPSEPEHYLNAQQVHGLTILRIFGWKLVCIRRAVDSSNTTILRNKRENALGILGDDGILRLSSQIKIRGEYPL